jgi:hypothetical protein
MLGEHLDDHGSKPPCRALGAQVSSRDTCDTSIAQGRISVSLSQTVSTHTIRHGSHPGFSTARHGSKSTSIFAMEGTQVSPPPTMEGT